MQAVDSPAIDGIDRAIIDVLRVEGRCSYQRLGERVGLSPNAAGDRVRRLQRSGVIVGYRAVVDEARLGRGLEVLVDVVRSRHHDWEEFEAAVAALPGVTEVLHVTGAADYQVRAALRGPADIDAFVRRLKDEDLGVARTETRLVLSRRTGWDI